MSTRRRTDHNAREPRLQHAADDLQRARLDDGVENGFELAHSDVDDAQEGALVEVLGVQRRHG